MLKQIAVAGLTGLVAGGAWAQSGTALSRADLGAWLAAYERAWETKDPAGAASLFAANARYFETPYAEPFKGPAGVRDYWAMVTADQRDIDFKSTPVAIEGNTAVAQWSATLTTISTGARVELNGVFVLEFDADKHCTLLREWWHAR